MNFVKIEIRMYREKKGNRFKNREVISLTVELWAIFVFLFSSFYFSDFLVL